MAVVLSALAIGLIAGVLSGLFGIGGGLVMVPAMTFFLGYELKTATGTSLMALLLPVAGLAVWNYAQAGHVNVRVGLLLGAGIFFGALLGSKIAIAGSESLLQRAFALLLVGAAVRLFVTA